MLGLVLRWKEFMRGDRDKVCLCLSESLCCRGEGERDRFVEMVDTDAEDADADRILLDVVSGSTLCLSRFRPLSSSAFAR
jgi:hypothetical protein